jgi:SAM-dependent methyltransferase
MNAEPHTTHILQANKDYFDRIANTGGYDESPFVEQVSRQIANAIKDEYDFDEDRTVMLDYACGTGGSQSVAIVSCHYIRCPLGQMSRLLAPYTHEIIGVDISQGMVDYYNQRVHNQGIPPQEIRAVCAELTGSDTDLDGKKFDIIVVSQALQSKINPLNDSL